MNDQDKFWLAGLLEGEGSFMAGTPSCPNIPKVCVTTTDKDIADRVGLLLEVKAIEITDKRYKEHGWKTPFFVKITGKKAVACIKELYPILGARRKKQCDKALACYRVLTKKMSKQDEETILELRQSGMIHRKIAEKLGYDRTTITKFLNR